MAEDEDMAADRILDDAKRIAEHLLDVQRHVNEQMGILLRGSVTFRIGDERKTLEPGATWVIPAHVPHDVAVGPDGAWLVGLFAPRRDDWGHLERLEPSAPPGF